MKVHQHKSNTGWLGAPTGISSLDCQGMPITRIKFDNMTVCFSYWRPSEEELVLLVAGKSVRLGVWA